MKVKIRRWYVLTRSSACGRLPSRVRTPQSSASRPPPSSSSTRETSSLDPKKAFLWKAGDCEKVDGTMKTFYFVAIWWRLWICNCSYINISIHQSMKTLQWLDELFLSRLWGDSRLCKYWQPYLRIVSFVSKVCHNVEYYFIFVSVTY